MRMQTGSARDAITRVNGTASIEVEEDAAGFLDDDFQGREIPGRRDGLDQASTLPEAISMASGAPPNERTAQN